VRAPKSQRVFQADPDAPRPHPNPLPAGEATFGNLQKFFLYSARVEITCFSGEKDSFLAAGKIARGSPARGCATTPVDGRLPPQVVFGPAFMPGIRGPTPRREARSRAFSLGQNTKRGRLARQARSAGIPAAKTNAGKMPALQRGIGLNTARESGSAGVSPAIQERTERPRERGLRCATCPKPETAPRRQTPGRRPLTADKARQRALGQESEPTPPQREGPSTGLYLGRFLNAATARSPVNGPSQRNQTQRRHSEKALQRAFDLADSPTRPAIVSKRSYTCATQAKSQSFSKNND